MKYSYRGISILLAMFVMGVTCIGQAARAQAAAPSDDAQALVKQGQKLNSEGKQDEALKLYKQALEKSPNLYEAHLESGVALDLKGDYAAAREHLKKAIDVAPADQPIPPEGAIEEAVESAKTFCGSEAPGFVNGVLAAALREVRENAQIK